MGTDVELELASPVVAEGALSPAVSRSSVAEVETSPAATEATEAVAGEVRSEEVRSEEVRSEEVRSEEVRSGVDSEIGTVTGRRSFSRLECGWSVWEIRKVAPKYRQQETAEYATCLTLVDSFHSVQGFFASCRTHSADDYLHGEKSLAVFRARRKPMWEYFPRGGRVVLRLRAEGMATLRTVWEEMLLLLVGENFCSPCVVGAMLNVKSAREASLSYWLSEDSLHGHVKATLRTILTGNDVIQCLPFKSLKKSRPRRVIGTTVNDCGQDAECTDVTGVDVEPTGLEHVEHPVDA
ncbi:eukaryotic initiation factor 4E [Gregarina niphandrodes]|uniref:Eukaryotic initiation factor 4E n=1 Tax=Gregarina niphandrodes TaxID=110365 RepID=A0A023B213_GRENI|nr:eukaryotic initiation factor 4E [Gregarina niphandrodes]EZG47615.1 eukaryotic initiation factor 4E [Gregarina niphandrodes]|eukprot:XP_011132165.1 eukaryotic initiation factor 4E [Gregarina niphandrodes]